MGWGRTCGVGAGGERARPGDPRRPPVTHAHRRRGRLHRGRWRHDDADLADHGLEWLEPSSAATAHPRTMRGLPGGLPPREPCAHGAGRDSALDLRSPSAVATWCAGAGGGLGTGDGVSTATLARALRWGGTVVTADPVTCRSACRPALPVRGHERVRSFSTRTTPVPFMDIETDPDSYRQTRRGWTGG